MQTSSNLAREHMEFIHSNSKGWITMAQKDPHNNRFKQYHYTAEEITANLAEWSGENVFFSQNTFYRPKRSIGTIQELRAIYVDVDTYTKGLDTDWVMGKLEYEYFGQSLPNPNMVLKSGKGLVIFWNIEPVPYMAMPLWKAVETYFINTLKDLGADPKASDPARIFRLAGTINSKNGAVVRAEYRHSYRYELRQLQYDYLPELTPSKTKEKKRGRKTKIVHMYNIYSLHLARIADLRTLIDLRSGDVGKCRETICFLYRYWTCCISDDPQRALEDTIELNNEFKYPLPKQEVIRATKSAEKAWEAKSNAAADKVAKEQGYIGAGYNLKNQTIINWLNITDEEQKHLKTIVGKGEKRKRNTKAKREKRRQEGTQERQVYIQEQNQKTEDKLQILKGHIRSNPKLKNTQAAKLMGVSESYIRKLKKQL